MRILHTSDWHLGQTLHNFDRSSEHADFLLWLLDTLEHTQTDALLIAGDIFDNANPSAAAQRQLYHFLTAARQRIPNLEIVLIAGNHDSPTRLEAPNPLLQLFSANVVGQPSRLLEGAVDVTRLVIPLHDRSGQVQAWCLAIPFLRPADVPRVVTQADAFAAGVALLHQQALAHALTLRQPGQALIAMGHCHAVGGQPSLESERRIVIGGAEAYSADLFDPTLAYVALGHLHLAQRVGGQERLRYSGSPLPLSFAETEYPHQVLQIDLAGEHLAEVTPIRVPRAVQLLRVPAQPAPLTHVLAELQALHLPLSSDTSRWPYLAVRVLLTHPEPGLRTQIETALEGKPVRLAKIEITTERAPDSVASPALSLDALQSLAPGDIFQQLYRQKYATDTPTDLLTAFSELLNQPSDDVTP
jgi:exonuclease SbcD